MNEIEKNKLKIQLIDIYSDYVKDNNNPGVKVRAQKIFFEFVYSTGSMDKDLMNAVTGLEHIGWEYSRSTKSAERDWKMSNENAQNILKELRKDF